MNCPHCNAENPVGARLCRQCGNEFEQPDPLIGQEVMGRYKVINLIGEGGMGRVYRAEQRVGTTTRKVAVKTLRPQLSADKQLARRFFREAETIVRLTHPNTIQFFDFGELPDSTLVIIMEFIEGRSLAQELGHGPLSAERADRIFAQVCGALAEAHGLGIVHRDLKPDNILLTERGGQRDFVKVLDFGIAKISAAGGEDDKSTKLTQQGMMVGTPPYMSPEQFGAESIDARSDIYSLGVIAFEMLTGKLPFMAKTPWEWASKHLTAEPENIEVNEGSGISLRRVQAIRKALNKARERRQQDVTELLRDFSGTGSMAHTATMVAPSGRSFPAPPLQTPVHAGSGSHPHAAGQPSPPPGSGGYAQPGYGSQPGAAQGYGSQPGAQQGHGSQPGAQGYGGQPGHGAPVSGGMAAPTPTGGGSQQVAMPGARPPWLWIGGALVAGAVAVIGGMAFLGQQETASVPPPPPPAAMAAALPPQQPAVAPPLAQRSSAHEVDLAPGQGEATPVATAKLDSALQAPAEPTAERAPGREHHRDEGRSRHGAKDDRIAGREHDLVPADEPTAQAPVRAVTPSPVSPVAPVVVAPTPAPAPAAEPSRTPVRVLVPPDLTDRVNKANAAAADKVEVAVTLYQGAARKYGEDAPGLPALKQTLAHNGETRLRTLVGEGRCAQAQALYRALGSIGAAPGKDRVFTKGCPAP
jgi:serine/threonine protein kinase